MTDNPLPSPENLLQFPEEFFQSDQSGPVVAHLIGVTAHGCGWTVHQNPDGSLCASRLGRSVLAVFEDDGSLRNATMWTAKDPFASGLTFDGLLGALYRYGSPLSPTPETES